MTCLISVEYTLLLYSTTVLRKRRHAIVIDRYYRFRDEMTWDSYIDSVIAYSRDFNGDAHVDKACIIGMDGGT